MDFRTCQTCNNDFCVGETNADQIDCSSCIEGNKLLEETPPEMCLYSAASRSVIDTFRPDGKTWFMNQTVEEVRKRYPDVEKMTLDEAVQRCEQACIDLVARAITYEDFNEALECLPPNGWVRQGNSESFKCCEHYSGRVTAIYARIGEKYYTFRDICSLKHDDIIAKVQRSCAGANNQSVPA